jgi:hypothetical protein
VLICKYTQISSNISYLKRLKDSEKKVSQLELKLEYAKEIGLLHLTYADIDVLEVQVG